MQVTNIMTHHFIRLTPETTIQKVLELFLEQRQDIACVFKDGEFTGIVTRNSITRLILQHAQLEDSIERAIINPVVSFLEDDSVFKAKEVLLHSNIAHSVIMNSKKEVTGILSRASIVTGLITESEHLAKRLRVLMNHLSSGVISVNMDERIDSLNEAAQNLLGNQKNDQILDKPISSVIPSILPTVKEALKTGTAFETMKIDINHTTLMYSVLPLKEWNQIIGAMIVLEDVTKYEKIASELESTKKIEQTLDNALELAYDAVLLTDSAGMITKANQGFLNMIEVDSLAEVIGQPLRKVAPEIYRSMASLGEETQGMYVNVKRNKAILTKKTMKKEGRSIGTIIKIIYKQLDAWKELFAHMDKLEHELNHYRQELSRVSQLNTTFSQLVTISPLLQRLKQEAFTAAQGFSSILIVGESGTGKELLANGINLASGRKGSFIKINCAAIPEALLESEFFGYDEGAFSGALKGGKPGKFELAEGGTLLLDEIGEMPLSLQVKLLRVLQEKEYERVGGTKTRKSDVRILASTNRNLLQLIKEGKFREDLYYRLNVIQLEIPPLRKRLEDIPILCEHFMQKFQRYNPKGVIGVTTDAFQKLQKYNWPGNVRQLENVLERAYHFCSENWITDYHIQLETTTPQPNQNTLNPSYPTKTLFPKKQMEDTEKEILLEALAQTKGNKTEAAQLLGISRSNIYQKLKRYGVITTFQ
ncbi:sigma 54-interacting transcriptional regulator [Peribacillus sp. NPDC097284]|uniref:sigma 54-interacting transcriptional regulator n=1 Tax=Peribacillus sp. NPDC097284 TaxID=3364401 RepID=UPI00380ECCF3